MAKGGIGRTELVYESNLRHSSLYSGHSQNYVESVSVEISTIITRLGYGEEMRRWRVENYRDWDRLSNERDPCTLQITSGSKAEGLTRFLESDRDTLFVVQCAICVDASVNLHIIDIPDFVEVYRMDTRAYPGHCTLLLERRAPRRPIFIQNALCDNGDGDVLLSSSLFVDELSPIHRGPPDMDGLVVHERAGPSIPRSVKDELYTDNVYSILCYCPTILLRWGLRPRHWPPEVIVHKVLSLGEYLTPVGFKGSEYKHMEWRICFNTGETELVNNFNDTQAKVFVLLKMILKDLMKPKNKEITSYVLKNIIFWQAENTPQTEFHSRSLLFWLHDGLKELRTAIEKKQLRYYMIPERNLMAASELEDALQRKWVSDITDMIEEGPRVILRLEKIRKAIVAHPEPMMWLSRRRTELEMLMLKAMNRSRELNFKISGVRSDFTMKKMTNRILEIMKEVRQRMHQENSSVDVSARILM